MKRVDKERQLSNAVAVFGKFKSFVVANFRCMAAGDFFELRRKLKLCECGLVVVKNSLARIALERLGKGELCDKFRGAVFVAYSDDIVTLSKVVEGFARNSEGKVALVCAYDGGEILPVERVKFFAALPSLRDLQVRLVALIGYIVPKRITLSMLYRKEAGGGKEE